VGKAASRFEAAFLLLLVLLVLVLLLLLLFVGFVPFDIPPSPPRTGG
jgi:hypothetical protein